MSKWKQQIDHELGSDQKFSKALEQKIIQKASKRTSRNFTYPITFVSACFIALILFFTWPENIPQERKANGGSLALNNLVNTDSVSAFYVSHLNPKDDQFLARPNSLAFGVEKFSSKDDIQVMMQMLKNVRLANLWWSDYNYDYDVVLKFNSGKEKKVKIFDINDSIGILDLETNLYYEVEGEYADIFHQTNDKGNSLAFLFTILNFITYLLICVNVKDKAPSSIKIFLPYIAITIAIFILQGQNIILSIWLPVALLIGLALQRYFKLQQEDYQIEKLRKLKLYTILLIVMWSIVFITQLLGGVL